MKQIKQTIFLCLLWMIGIGVHAEEIPNNEIWYTSSGGKVVTPYRSNDFGAEIISNTYSNGKGVIVFDNSVTSIGNDAFRFCSGLTSITIPNSVTSIGDGAFCGCSGLTSITIPNSVTSIGDYAFYDCAGLTSITVESSNSNYDSRDNCNAIIETATNTLIAGCKNTVIPNSVTSIGDDAFVHCSGLTSIDIPNSVTSIGDYAFDGCSGLTSITIPNSVTSIGNGAFGWTENVTTITVDKMNQFYDSRDNCKAIIETRTNTLIAGCKNTITPNSVTSIGDYAFAGCSGLTSITIPNSVTSIGNSAFSGCSGLTSITIPNSVTSIGNSAFSGCSGLTSINIPNSVTSIGEDLFFGCTGLTSITIPNSVTSIGNYAFYKCSSLTSITIPNSVTSIGDWAFYECYFSSFVNNSSLDAESNNYWGAKICNNDGLVIEDNIIVDCAKRVTSINIPNSVTSIGDYAFECCFGLTSITIPNSVISIGWQAFRVCSGLTSITIPNSVTSIGDDAFSGCYFSSFVNNSSLDAESNNYWGAKICNNDGLVIDDNIIVDCAKWVTSINIPNSVTSIGYGAFNNCSGLTSITIPNSVTSIGEMAFSYCSGLTSITIPNSVTSIGEGAFEGWSGLTSIFVSWSQPLSISTDVFRFFYKTKCVLYVPKGTSTLYKSAPVWEDFQNIQEYEYEEFLANKKAFEEYKNAEKADAENLAKKGDSQAVLTLITNAKSDIDDLTYDKKITLEANKSKVDSIMTKLENDIKAQRIKEEEQLAADKAAFEIYKTTRKADAEKLAKSGDSQVILEMVSKAKTAIDALTYDEKYSLEDNKKDVDAVFNKLESDIKAQRIKEEQLAADKAAYEIYKTTRKADAEKLAKSGDSQVILEMVSKAKTAIDALTYDEKYSLEDNKKDVDAVFNKLESDIKAQRIKEEQLAADKAAFEIYKTTRKADAENLIKDGDSPSITIVINTAKSAIDALKYDESTSLADNKKAVDAIIEELRSNIQIIRDAEQQSANKATFEAYKMIQEMNADNLVNSGDSQTIHDMVSKAKTTIESLNYDTTITLDDNKAKVDAIISELESKIKAQREADRLAADKAAFEAYKSAKESDADDLAKSGDSQVILDLVSNAKTAIDALTYNESISLEDNKDLVDAVFNKLESDIKAQRVKEEQLIADKAAFEAYKSAKKSDADDLAKDGDSQVVLDMVSTAKTVIQTLAYDESLSLDDNKKAVDAVFNKLESDVKAQREAEELWANKLAFNTYRNSRKSDADALAKPDDSQEILAIITRAKEEIEGLEYDQSKSLSDNMAAVDAIIRQLKTDLENARIAAGMNGIITSDGNLQIHTLDGRKVDSIVKSGFYIINGVKKYVNGNCK